MESSATEAARKKANALLAERAAIVKVGVDECLKCTVEVPSEICRFCDQPAIMRNRGHCAACASFWIPALNRPGSLLSYQYIERLHFGGFHEAIAHENTENITPHVAK